MESLYQALVRTRGNRAQLSSNQFLASKQALHNCHNGKVLRHQNKVQHMQYHPAISIKLSASSVPMSFAHEKTEHEMQRRARGISHDHQDQPSMQFTMREVDGVIPALHNALGGEKHILPRIVRQRFISHQEKDLARQNDQSIHLSKVASQDERASSIQEEAGVSSSQQRKQVYNTAAQHQNHYLPLSSQSIGLHSSQHKLSNGQEPKLPQDRRNLLICILVSLFSIQTLNMNVSTIVPNYVNDNHNTLTETQVALIMTSFEVAALIFSPLVGLMLERLGRKNSIMIGFVVVITSTFGLGLTQHIKDDYLFLVVSICARFIQGMGDMWVQTSYYSLMTYKFSDNREKYLGMGESAAGLGCMLGPVMGSIFYTYMGYQYAFFTFGVFLSFSAFLSYFVLPNNLNVKLDTMSDLEKAQSEKIGQQYALQSNQVPFLFF